MIVAEVDVVGWVDMSNVRGSNLYEIGDMSVKKWTGTGCLLWTVACCKAMCGEWL